MYALIYKDFLLLKKQLLYVLVLAVFYTVIAVSGFLSASILPGMVVLFATMLPITSFSYDEQARWGQYAAATPAGRRGVVAAKYLFSLLLLLLGLLLVSALITLLVGLGLLREPLPTALYAVLCCGSVALGIDAVLLPVLLKHGAEKGRFAIMDCRGRRRDAFVAAPPRRAPSPAGARPGGCGASCAPGCGRLCRVLRDRPAHL